MKFVYPDGATPIDPNEEKDLIPSNITTQDELNEVEYENIVRSRVWSRSRKQRNLLTVAFMERLHKSPLRYRTLVFGTHADRPGMKSNPEQKV